MISLMLKKGAVLRYSREIDSMDIALSLRLLHILEIYYDWFSSYKAIALLVFSMNHAILLFELLQFRMFNWIKFKEPVSFFALDLMSWKRMNEKTIVLCDLAEDTIYFLYENLHC